MIENEYGIKNKPSLPVNQQANEIIERLHQVLRNLVRTYNLQETYVEESDPWIRILTTAPFAVRSMYQTTKGQIPGQIIFGRDMILPKYHVTDWRYICQRKQAQIDKYFIGENTIRVDQYYIVSDKLTTLNNSA